MGKAKIKKEKLKTLLEEFNRGIIRAMREDLLYFENPNIVIKEIAVNELENMKRHLDYIIDIIEILEILKKNKKVEVS